MRALAAVLIAACVCGTRAQAQMLEVAPVSIVFAPEQRAASMTVTNRSNAPVVIQVRPFVWRETDGSVSLTDTAALAVSPPFAEVAPGQAQSIRLVLRSPPGAAESTYRLFIDELPPPNTPGIRVALRISLPVFAQPTVQAAAALVWQIVQGRRGSELEVRNRGNRHATIIAAQVHAPGGGTVSVRTSDHPYVLPGATSRWPIGSARLQGGEPAQLTITTDMGVQKATAAIVTGVP